MRFFSTETRVYQWLNKYCTILLIGFVWLIMCLPLVSIGASCTAVNRMMFNIRENKAAGVVLFFKIFLKEFRKSTRLWLMALILPAVILAVYLFTGISSTAAITVIFIAVVLWMFVFLYVFPLTAFFENTIVATLKNGLLMSLRHIKNTVPALAISMLPVFAYMIIGKEYFLYSGWVWVFILLPMMEYWKSYFFLKVFYEYLPEEQRTAFPADEQEE